MPQLDVCTSCRKLYPRVQVRLCQACVVDDAKRFDLVRAFLAQAATTAVGIPEIVEWTGLSRGEIARFQSDGRLVNIDPGPGGRPTTCTCTIGALGRCAHCRMVQADGMRAQLDDPDARRPIGEIAGTLPPRPSRSFGAPANAEDPRVQYVRRSRRSA